MRAITYELTIANMARHRRARPLDSNIGSARMTPIITRPSSSQGHLTMYGLTNSEAVSLALMYPWTAIYTMVNAVSAHKMRP